LVIVESVTPGVKTKNEVSSAGKTVKEATVFVSPKIACNVMINQEFDLLSDPEDEESKKRTYKFKFNKTMTKITNLDKPSEVIEFDQATVNNLIKKNDQFVLKFNKMLPPNTNFEVQVVVDMREIINGNEVLPIDDKGKKYTEKEARQTYKYYFKTGELPDRIDEDNIVDAYPMNRQFETFVQDGQKGFIILQYSQEYLIKNRDMSLGNDALFGEFINLTNKREPPVYFNYKYKTYTQQEPRSYRGKPSIEFDLKNLIPGHIYQVKFYVVNKSATVAEHAKKTTTSEIQISESQRTKLLSGTTGGSDMSSTTTMVDKITKQTSKSSETFTDASKKEETALSKIKSERNADIKDVFMYHFRTSSYKSITEKMKNIEVIRDLGNKVSYIRKRMKNGQNASYAENSILIMQKNNNRNLYLHYLTPEIKVRFPIYTTQEEVVGGKAFEGQNAEVANSMFQLINLNGSSYTRKSDSYGTSYFTYNYNNYYNDNHYAHIIGKYGRFMRSLAEYSTNVFDIMGNYIAYYNLFYWNGFESAIPSLNECISSEWKTQYFEGRLTDYEIQSGKINRSWDSPRLFYRYPHFRVLAQHLGFAMRIADDLMYKWHITWNNHNIEVSDYKGYKISLWVKKLRDAGETKKKGINKASR
jgi:hypothetical protein